MLRILLIVLKELKSVKANLPFNLITFLSPILFFLVFSVMLTQDITMPVVINPGPHESQLSNHIGDYSNPNNTPYFKLTISKDSLEKTDYVNKIEIVEEPKLIDGKISGKVVQYFGDVNTNTTKNYRNRLTGAISSYLEKYLNGKAVTIEEFTQYETDIPWDISFGTSILVMGILLAGFLFGSLSFTQEWESDIYRFLTLSPANPIYLISGKIIAGIIKGLFSTYLFSLLLFFVEGEIPSQPGLFLLTVTLAYLAALTFGMLIGLLIRSTLTSFLVSLIGSLVFWIMGGGFGSMAVFSTLTQNLSLINPATHVLNLIRYIYFGGFVSINTELIYLLLFSILALPVLYLTYTKRIVKGGGLQ